MVTGSLAPEDPSKKNLFSKTLPETGRETGISQTAYTPLYPLFQCFFRLSSVKNYFSIVAFQKTPVSLENLNHFWGHYPLTPLRHFENFSLTVFLKKLKKEQFDCSYFCDSRYIYRDIITPQLPELLTPNESQPTSDSQVPIPES